MNNPDLYFRITDGIAMADIIGWMLAACAGVIAYRVIDKMQTSMERHAMLATIEDGYSAIYDSVVAKSNGDGSSDKKIEELDNVMVRSVLHDDTPWTVIKKDGKIECRIINNQRYVHIRNNDRWNEWISTQALHEITLKARRLEKMFKAGLVKRVDLADLFREIAPLGVSGRLEFIVAYYSEYDAECVAYLVLQTIVSCEKYQNYDIVKYFTDYYNAHEDIHIFFEKNRRFIPVIDWRARKKFDSIIEKSKAKSND